MGAVIAAVGVLITVAVWCVGGLIVLMVGMIFVLAARMMIGGSS
jgi:hypothetical protein